MLDYGDVVVHVLTPEQRDFYDLESFYGAAEEIELAVPQGRAKVWRQLGKGPTILMYPKVSFLKKRISSQKA